MDKVFIKGLVLYSLIGVYDFERHAKQRLILDIEIDANLKLAGCSDNVTDTLDYGAIAERLAQIASRSSYQLLEALGEEMVNMILSDFNVSAVSLTINKPDILDNVEGVGIVLNRCKQTTDELQNGTTENGSCQNSTKVSV
jgi:dihydroneopterin aldolase